MNGVRPLLHAHRRLPIHGEQNDDGEIVILKIVGRWLRRKERLVDDQASSPCVRREEEEIVAKASPTPSLCRGLGRG